MVPEIRIWIKARKKMAVVCMIDYDEQTVDWKGNLGEWLPWTEVEFMVDTGVRDSDGKTIFSDDVVDIEENGNLKRVQVLFPEFLIEEYDKMVGLGHKKVTVIGNAYENPELVE